MEENRKLRVYCETTVISDMTSRPSPLIRNLARQIATREWWEGASGYCEFFVSQLVAVESDKGDQEASQRRRELLSSLKWLEYGKKALDLARIFLNEAAIPETSFDDATHIAIATIAGMDCLATWNCRHINNPQKLPQIQAICKREGYKCPIVGTPEQLKEVYHG